MCIYKHTFLGVHMLFLSKCTMKLTMTKQRLAIFLGVVMESTPVAPPLDAMGDGLQFWERWFISLSLLKILGHLQRSSSLLTTLD